LIDSSLNSEAHEVVEITNKKRHSNECLFHDSRKITSSLEQQVLEQQQAQLLEQQERQQEQRHQLA
jgi:hypothetical protein